MGKQAFKAAVEETGQHELKSTMKNGVDKYIKSHCNDFVADVCHLAWNMVLQSPVMWFDTSAVGSPPDGKYNQLSPSADTDCDNLVVSYYLEPTLMQGEQVFETGRVRGVKKITDSQDDANSTCTVMETDNEKIKLVK